MSKFVKLPDSLKSWKITNCISNENGNVLYSVSKKDIDSTVITAKLRYISISKDSYTNENIDFIDNEVKFLKTICQSGNYYNYIDIAVNNNPAKEKIELFLVTDDLPSLADTIKEKSLQENEIIDFGIQMSTILENLESNNIFHGNINLDNIYVTKDGNYKLGGFSDFESQIDDMSFVAPEIKRNESADFTTDIYSLGLILYYLCNNNNLPFMSDSVNKEAAINYRFEGKSVNAPANGSEKLKSVIVIACQSNNSNRWKNASNIKNALTSIKNELPKKENNTVIVPESTDFSGNVFEEFEYEEFDIEETAPTTTSEESSANQTNESDNSITESPDDVPQDIEEAIEFNTEIDSEEYTESTDNNEEFINDNNTDDDISSKVIDFSQTVKDKDYGNYFDDEGVNEITEVANSINNHNNDEILNYDVDDFAEDDFDKDITENQENKKKGKTAVIISIIIILLALCFVGYFVLTSVLSNNTSDTKPTTETTTQEIETTISATQASTSATTQPTTVPETTVEETTISKANVVSVVGYYYSYAKELLEEEGFTVEVGEYRYDDYYEEGYVIYQSPDGDTEAEKGSVITLDVSLGLNEPEPTEPEVKPTDNTYLFANSDSSYLSQSDVDSLDRTTLNLALNEIYARRGRIFKDASISAYFNSKTWYTPKYTSDEFSANVTFNKYEEANLHLMVNEQKSRGYR